ncbi:hypothetical protein PMAYCL1PPCAC_24283, partial [Pristionchus mayeri]
TIRINKLVGYEQRNDSDKGMTDANTKRNIESDTEIYEIKQRILELQSDDSAKLAEAEKREKESSTSEEIRELEELLEISNDNSKRLGNELAQSKAMIGAISEDRQILLSAVSVLNKRVEDVTGLNQQLEYQLDLSSRQYGLQAQQESAKQIEDLGLRVMKAENSLAAAKMQATNWRERYDEVFDQLAHLQRKQSETGIANTPEESSGRDLQGGIGRDKDLLLENALLRKELEHMRRIMESKNYGPNISSKSLVDSKKRKIENSGEIMKVSSNSIEEGSSAGVSQALASTVKQNENVTIQENLMAILRPHRAITGYVLNIDASLRRLFNSLKECDEKQLLEIEQRLFKWNTRCEVCCVSIGFRSIHNLFEHLIGTHHQLALRKSESRVSQAAFDHWETMLRQCKKQSQNSRVQPSALPEAQGRTNRKGRVEEDVLRCTVPHHVPVSNVAETLCSLSNKWKELNMEKKREFRKKKQGVIVSCGLCKKDNLAIDNFFGHVGSVFHIRQMKQNAIKLCEESVNALMNEM